MTLTRPNPFRTVRGRLTLWQTAVLAVVLVLGTSIAYLLFRAQTLEHVDHTLSNTADAFVQSLTADPLVAGNETAEIRDGLNEFRFRDITIVVYDPQLTTIGVSVTPEPLPEADGRGHPIALDALARQSIRRAHLTTGFTRLYDGHHSYRLYTKPITLGHKNYTLAVLTSLEEERTLLRDTKTAVALAIPIILIIATLGGALLANRALAPVTAMTTRAAHIGAGDTTERLPVHNPHDELGRLARVFNDLLGRLHEALDRQRQFMTDASHELRTPVAVIRAEVEVTLAQAHRTEAEYRETLTTIDSSSRRLSGVIGNLFLLARADAGQYPITRAPTYLTDIITESVKTLRALSEQRSITLTLRFSDDDAPYEGDVELLHRLVTNLVDNALKHGAPHTTTQVALSTSPTDYIIDVTNQGPEIPPQLQSHIFDRFAQLPHTREHRERGAGLGLPIARWIAEAHGGTLELVQSAAESTTFRCTLPRLAI